jgi:hypothetical protein
MTIGSDTQKLQRAFIYPQICCLHTIRFILVARSEYESVLVVPVFTVSLQVRGFARIPFALQIDAALGGMIRRYFLDSRRRDTKCTHYGIVILCKASFRWMLIQSRLHDNVLFFTDGRY